MKKAASAKLEVQEKRLSTGQVGLDLRVRIYDQGGNVLSGQPFTVKAGNDVLMEGMTDEDGEFTGQRVLELQTGVKRQIFLALDGSPVTDWKTIGGEPKTPCSSEKIGVDVRLLNAAGTPLENHPFKVAINDSGPFEVSTDELGHYRREEVVDIQADHRRKIRITLLLNQATGTDATQKSSMTDFSDNVVKRTIVPNGSTLRLEKGENPIKRHLVVEDGGHLVIEPGAVLTFSQYAGILCKGQLTAVGTKERPIFFTGTDWRNITLLGQGAGGSHLEYCVIQGGTGMIVDTNSKNDPACNKSLGGGISLISIDKPLLGFDDEQVLADNKLNRVILRQILVQKNRARHGGGLYCYQSSPLIDDCTFSSNEARGDLYSDPSSGGGICVVGSRPEFRDIRLLKNSSPGWGGGLSVLGSILMIERGEFTGNTGAAGGAISSHDTNLTLRSSKIRKNSTSRYEEKNAIGGGGISFSGDGLLVVDETEITENQSACSGGGLFLNGSGTNTTLQNCTIAKNVARHWGGGISIKGGKLRVKTSRINRNTTSARDGYYVKDGDFFVHPSGGGINAQDRAEAIVEKSEIHENSSGYGGGMAILSSTIRLNHSTVESNDALNGIGDVAYIENDRFSNGGLSAVTGTLCGKLERGRAGSTYSVYINRLNGEGTLTTSNTRVVGRVVEGIGVGSTYAELSLKGGLWSKK